MTTTQELERKIADAARLKRDAEEREAARLRAEQAARDEIARADAEIAALQAELRAAAYAEAQTANARLVAANDTQARSLVAALNLAAQQLLVAARGELQAVQQTFAEQDQFAAQTINRALHGVDFRQPGDRSERDATTRMLAEVARLENGLDVALPPWAVIARWIAESDSEQQRRIRQGIGYALTGQVYSPDRDYSPQAEMRRVQQDRRRLRF